MESSLPLLVLYLHEHGLDVGEPALASPHVSMFTGGDDAAGFAPSFIEKPKIIPNETGTLITMRCKCKAKPKPEVTWFRGTTIVKESSKISINIKDVEENIYELTLEIKDPAAEDGGTYRCHVKNEFGESNANLNLNIEAEPEPEGDGPTFVEKPRITSHQNGKLVVMDCKVRSFIIYSGQRLQLFL